MTWTCSWYSPWQSVVVNFALCMYSSSSSWPLRGGSGMFFLNKHASCTVWEWILSIFLVLSLLPLAYVPYGSVKIFHTHHLLTWPLIFFLSFAYLLTCFRGDVMFWVNKSHGSENSIPAHVFKRSKVPHISLHFLTADILIYRKGEGIYFHYMFF